MTTTASSLCLRSCALRRLWRPMREMQTLPQVGQGNPPPSGLTLWFRSWRRRCRRCRMRSWCFSSHLAALARQAERQLFRCMEKHPRNQVSSRNSIARSWYSPCAVSSILRHFCCHVRVLHTISASVVARHSTSPRGWSSVAVSWPAKSPWLSSQLCGVILRG